MSIIWSSDRLKEISIAPRTGTYEAIPQSDHEYKVKATHPHLFTFQTVSIGDAKGQMCFVPLDESSEETAKFIVEAVKFYTKHLENK